MIAQAILQVCPWFVTITWHLEWQVAKLSIFTTLLCMHLNIKLHCFLDGVGRHSFLWVISSSHMTTIIQSRWSQYLPGEPRVKILLISDAALAFQNPPARTIRWSPQTPGPPPAVPASSVHCSWSSSDGRLAWLPNWSSLSVWSVTPVAYCYSRHRGNDSHSAASWCKSASPPHCQSASSPGCQAPNTDTGCKSTVHACYVRMHPGGWQQVAQTILAWQ